MIFCFVYTSVSNIEVVITPGFKLGVQGLIVFITSVLEGTMEDTDVIFI